MVNVQSGQHILMPFLHIRYIKCTEKVPRLMIAVTGLLTSLWANCIMVVILFRGNYNYNPDNDNYIDNNYQDNENFVSKTILQTSQLTHLVIVLTCTAGLILGLKEKNPTYLLPWLIIKTIELNGLFVGCILLAACGEQAYIAIMPLGICFLLTGGYFSLCVWNTYSKMNDLNNLDRPPSLDNFGLDGPDDLPLPVYPPSYDDSSMNIDTRT